MIECDGDMNDLINLLPQRIKMLMMFTVSSIRELAEYEEEGVLHGLLLEAKKKRNEGTSVEYEVNEIKNKLNKLKEKYERQRDDKCGPMHSSQIGSGDVINLKSSSLDGNDDTFGTSLQATPTMMGRKKRKLWQAHAHIVSPSLNI